MGDFETYLPEILERRHPDLKTRVDYDTQIVTWFRMKEGQEEKNRDGKNLVEQTETFQAIKGRLRLKTTTLMKQIKADHQRWDEEEEAQGRLENKEETRNHHQVNDVRELL